MKLLHISDWHATPGQARIKLKTIPDLNYAAVAITGDMWADLDAEWQRDAWKVLVKDIGERWPGRPIVIVYGNHDKYLGPIRGAKVFNKGAHNYTANGVKFTGLYVPTIQIKGAATLLPEVEWFEKQIPKLDSCADVLLCHYPSNYLPHMDFWLDSEPTPSAYLSGHIHEDFGVSLNSGDLYSGTSRLHSNASQGYTVIDTY